MTDEGTIKRLPPRTCVQGFQIVPTPCPPPTHPPAPSILLPPTQHEDLTPPSNRMGVLSAGWNSDIRAEGHTSPMALPSLPPGCAEPIWAPGSPLLSPATATIFPWPLLFAECLPHVALCKHSDIITRKMGLGPEAHAPTQAHLGHLLKRTLLGSRRAGSPGLGAQRTGISDKFLNLAPEVENCSCPGGRDKRGSVPDQAHARSLRGTQDGAAPLELEDRALWPLLPGSLVTITRPSGGTLGRPVPSPAEPTDPGDPPSQGLSFGPDVGHGTTDLGFLPLEANSLSTVPTREPRRREGRNASPSAVQAPQEPSTGRAARVGARYTSRHLIPKGPRAEWADLGKRPLPGLSTGRLREKPGRAGIRTKVQDGPETLTTGTGPGSRPPTPTSTSSASPQVRERPHFSSRRSGQYSAFCTMSAHWADSTDAPPRAPNWPLARGFTSHCAAKLRGSLGLSGLCLQAPGPSPKETSGTRARGTLGDLVLPFPRRSPACPRMDASPAKGSLQTLPHIGDAAPLRVQVSRAPPDWKIAPGLGFRAGHGSRTCGSGKRGTGRSRRRGRCWAYGSGGGAQGRRAAGSPHRPRPRPARVRGPERSGCARSGARREVPRQRERRRRRRRRLLVRFARRAAAARGERVEWAGRRPGLGGRGLRRRRARHGGRPPPRPGPLPGTSPLRAADPRRGSDGWALRTSAWSLASPRPRKVGVSARARAAAGRGGSGRADRVVAADGAGRSGRADRFASGRRALRRGRSVSGVTVCARTCGAFQPGRGAPHKEWKASRCKSVGSFGGGGGAFDVQKRKQVRVLAPPELRSQLGVGSQVCPDLAHGPSGGLGVSSASCWAFGESHSWSGALLQKQPGVLGGLATWAGGSPECLAPGSGKVDTFPSGGVSGCSPIISFTVGHPAGGQKAVKTSRVCLQSPAPVLQALLQKHHFGDLVHWHPKEGAATRPAEEALSIVSRSGLWQDPGTQVSRQAALKIALLAYSAFWPGPAPLEWSELARNLVPHFNSRCWAAGLRFLNSEASGSPCYVLCPGQSSLSLKPPVGGACLPALGMGWVLRLPQAFPGSPQALVTRAPPSTLPSVPTLSPPDSSPLQNATGCVRVARLTAVRTELPPLPALNFLPWEPSRQ
ncbi:hypothetical protein Cadr_000030867 [Camelus dromedarius]|uniref:Uncharacterized protein n=1 Tax=Camelus dromedarius TaxID=9838 RepID=A0A5N4BYX4_CAMDR|nr:hypothetical protein Cadr_000030867 [Camelus dromedarius]